ncbi:hypothetical protein ABEB36_013998 [Hypothenemus hampei]|uniref:THAP-type domain-containing protein n=1 Tax=Hypothenemus hampei TaxID=57062 RepID=A0ABD1E305_HYPHA
MVWYCCVPNCKPPKQGEKVFIMRMLPIRDPERYKIWINRIGNSDLKNCEDLKEAYKKYRVCERHFSSHCIITGEKQIKRDSLLTLHLPSFHEESSRENSLFRFFKKKQQETNIAVKDFASLPEPSNVPDLEIDIQTSTLCPTNLGKTGLMGNCT